MKGISTLTFALLMLSAGAMAKDRTKGGESPPERPADAVRANPENSSDRIENEKAEPTPEIVPADGPRTVEQNAGAPKVEASTAPVPVKSLGIRPKSLADSKAREAQNRKVRIGKIAAAATPAAKARKSRSHEILRAEAVPLNLKLPAIPDSEQTTGRTHREVVIRTLAVLTTAVKGEGLPQDTVDALIDDFGVREHLSPDEAAFIADASPVTADRVQFAWRYEAAWTMLWALSAVDTLPPPREIVDVRAIAEIVRGENVETLIAKTSLRPMEQLLDEADLIYRYRWALVDARINDRDPPAGLDPGVALERHRALNWLIGYLGQDWDEVTPDT